MKLKIDFFSENIYRCNWCWNISDIDNEKWKRRKFIYWRICVRACALRGTFI